MRTRAPITIEMPRQRRTISLYAWANASWEVRGTPALSLDAGSAGGNRGWCRVLPQRLPQQKLGSAPLAVTALDTAAVLQRDFLNHGETQASALGFGGVKRQENFGQVRLRNSRAVVRHADALPLAAAQFLDGAGNGDAGSFAGGQRRFRAVARQVQQGLPQQSFVARQVLEGAFELDSTLRNGFVQLFRYFFHHRLHRHSLVADFQRLREAQELRDHV